MIRKLEDKVKNKALYHMIDGGLIDGPNPNMSGYCSGLSGNCTGVWGYCTGVSGDLDLCEITHDLRKHGVKLEHLIFKSEEEK